MAADGDPQANQTSVQREERMCTALWGRVSPKGLSCFRGTSALSPEWAGRGGKWGPKKRGGRCG